MRRSNLVWLVLLAGTFLMMGCKSNNKGKIEGTKWASEAATIKGNNFPPGTFQLDFGKDGSIVFTIKGNPFRGKYSLGWGERVTLHMDQAFPGTNTSNYVDNIVIKGDRMTMTDPDGTTMTLTRMK